MPISLLALSFGKNVENVTIIDADVYCLACWLKEAQVFVIFIKNLEFQAEKRVRPETNPKTVILEKYYNLLYVFLKKDLDTFFFYQKYDYKIILEKKQKYGYALLYKMLLQELDTVKRYLNSNSAKMFIQASSASYLFPILFVKKSGKGI